jgi:hypothetical protein
LIFFKSSFFAFVFTLIITAKYYLRVSKKSESERGRGSEGERRGREGGVKEGMHKQKSV